MLRNLRNPVADDNVELVDDGDLSITYRLRRQCSKYRMLVLALVLLFLAGAMSAIIFTLIKKSNSEGQSPIATTSMTASPHHHRNTTKKPPTTSPTEPPTGPLSPSEVISNQLDKNVDPCDDFYSYACGGFVKTHHLSVSQSSESGFTIVNDDNMEVLRQAMETAASNYSQSSSIVKTAKIYDTCVDTAAIERRGISPLENLIEQYGGWTVTGNGTNSWTVAEKMGAVRRDLNVQSLLSVSVGIDLQDSSKHILSIGISSLGMGIEYYFDDSDQGEQVSTKGFYYGTAKPSSKVALWPRGERAILEKSCSERPRLSHYPRRAIQ